MGDTTQRYKIYLYKPRKGYELIEELNVRNTFEPRRWRKPMPTIGEKRCREIIKKISSNVKTESVTVLIENVKTGNKHTQELNRNGTVITED